MRQRAPVEFPGSDIRYRAQPEAQDLRNKLNARASDKAKDASTVNETGTSGTTDSGASGNVPPNLGVSRESAEEVDLQRRILMLSSVRDSFIRGGDGGRPCSDCTAQVPFAAAEHRCPECSGDQVAHYSSRIASLQAEYQSAVAQRKQAKKESKNSFKSNKNKSKKSKK